MVGARTHPTWGSAVAGLVGVGGLALLYRGLARGRASVVAPLSAVGAAVLQVAWGLAGGEEPGGWAIAGIVLALVAIGVVAGSADAPSQVGGMSRQEELLCGLGAAVGFGAYLILISETSSGAGLGTVVAAVAPVVVLTVVLALAWRPSPRPARAPPRLAVGRHGRRRERVLLVAVRTGLLTVVAPVANLYPAVTVVLARAFGHERIGRFRLAGLVLAVASLVLISV